MSKTVTMDNMDDLFEEMIDAQCEEIASEQESSQAVNVLSKFKEYISSQSFNKKCKEKSKELGIKDYRIVKNRFIHGALSKIANIFNLAIDITGDVVLFAVQFLSALIGAVVNFASKVCHKIINLLTLNCGMVAA